MISMSRRSIGPGLQGALFDSDPATGYSVKYQMSSADLADAVGDAVIEWGPSRPECRAIIFDGVDQYLNKDADVSKLSRKQAAFSMSLWAKFNAQAAADQIILQYGTDSAGGTGFSLKVLQNTSTIRFTSNGTTTDVSATAGKWFFYALTISAGTRKAYINNGSPVTEAKAVNVFSGATLRIAASSTPGLFLAGGVDDVRAYNSVLTAGNIETLWNYYCNELTYNGEILTFENDPLTFDWRGL